jgi:hypothetical protein
LTSSYARGQKVLNLIALASEVDGEAILPAKQLSTLMEIAQVFETALIKIMRGEAGDDPEGVAEMALAEVNRMIESM